MTNNLNCITIENNEISNDRERILELYKECLPGTTSERIKWLNHKDANKIYWILARDTKINKIIGVTSIFTKKIWLKKKSMMAGIIGDIMVDEKYRGKKISTAIQQYILENFEMFGLQYLYVIPNEISDKILTNLRYEYIGKIKTLILPISTAGLNNRLKNSVIDDMYKRIIRTLYKCGTSKKNIKLIEHKVINNELIDKINKKNIEKKSFLISDHDNRYMKWRYLTNRRVNRKIKYIYNEKNECLGIIVFKLVNKILEIEDLILLDNKFFGAVVYKVVLYAMSISHDKIRIRMLQNNPYYQKFRKKIFIDNKDDAKILAYGYDIKKNINWEFYAGDRNL